jgi:hypothetical protein
MVTTQTQYQKGNTQVSTDATGNKQTKTQEMISMKQLTMTNVNGVGSTNVVALKVEVAFGKIASVAVFGYSPYGGRRTYLSKTVEGKRVRERMTVPAFVNVMQPHLAQADLNKLRTQLNTLKPIFTRNFLTCLCINCQAPVSAAEMDYIQRNAESMGVDDFQALCMKCQPKRGQKAVIKPAVKLDPKAEVKPEAKAQGPQTDAQYMPTVEDMVKAKEYIADLQKTIKLAPKKARRDIAGSNSMKVTVSMIESIYEMCNAAFGDKTVSKAKLISRIQDNVECIMDTITQMNIMPAYCVLQERTTFKSQKAKDEHYAIVTELPESIQPVSESSDNSLEISEELIQAVSEALEFECDICTLVKPLVYNQSLNHHVCQSCSDNHNAGPLFTPDCGPALDITYDAVSGSMVVDNAESNDFLCATPDCVSLPMHGSTLCPSCVHEEITRNLHAISKRK